MRSARAESVKGPAAPFSTSVPLISANDALRCLAPLLLGLREPVEEAREPGQPECRDARVTRVLFQHRLRDLVEFVAHGLRQCGRMLRCERRQHLMDQAALEALIGRLPEHRQRLQTQHVACEDRIGIADPFFDPRNAHAARPQAELRTRFGRAEADALCLVDEVARARPAEPRPLRLQRVRHVHAVEQRGKAHQPARRHGRHAFDLFSARQVDALGAHQRDEVVRRAADIFFRRGQA